MACWQAGRRAQTPDEAGSGGCGGNLASVPGKEFGFGGEKAGSSRRLQELGAPPVCLPELPPPSPAVFSWREGSWLLGPHKASCVALPYFDFLGCLLPWGEGCSWFPRIPELWRPRWGLFAKAVCCIWRVPRPLPSSDTSQLTSHPRSLPHPQ